ncbi:transglutaminaseTgpA domain-containing protein [Thiohalophilus sp.]|uniref:transglutaminase family protein n=1 Tax=Thiohalophilus sp. TaxID=3028392 RepID=UPI0039767CFF
MAWLNRLPLPNALLLVAIVLLILPHLPHFPIWLSSAVLGVIVWRLLYDIGRVPLPNRFIRILLVLLGIAALLLTYRTLVGREAGTALLVLMLALKLFEMRGWRDVTVVVFLGFFVMVTAFLFSQSLLMGAYTLVVVTLLTASLISFQQPVRTVAREPLLGDLRHAFRILVQALPVALILFVLFPRIPGPLWGLPEDAGTSRTGLSDEMEPGRISRLADSNEVAFRVQFEANRPSSAQRYWRGPVLWQYDGRKWKTEPHQIRLPQQFDLDSNGPALEYQITLEPHNRQWLFALEMPASIPEQAQLNSEYQLLARRRISEVFRYEVRSYTDYRLDPRILLDRERYLALPPDTSPRTRELVKELAAETTSSAQMIQKVLNYFAEQPFYYTREPPLLFDDPVDEFMFETQRGFCEHYASAFTVMMRQAGIPARVVTGYYGGEMNPLADYMIVRQSDAHAWSEVWLRGRGWVRVDPTGVIPPSRVELSADLAQREPEVRSRLDAERPWWKHSLRRAGFAWDAVNNRWQQWVVGYNQNRQNALLRALGLDDINWGKLVFLLMVMVSLALLVIAALVFRTDRDAERQVNRLYRRFLRRLARRGMNKLPAETPGAFSERAVREQPARSQRIRQITQTYLLLRYADLDTQTQRRHLKWLARAVRQFRPD